MICLLIFSQNSYKIIVLKLELEPFFNEDLLNYKSIFLFYQEIPNPVQEFIKLTARASAVIFITAEYNGAVSSSILNAYEWIT